MSKKSQKNQGVPRRNKTKEELLEETKKFHEAQRKRIKAKEELYPLLLEKTKSIEDADTFCQATAMAIKQAFNNQMRVQKIKDLGLIAMIHPDAEGYERYKTIFEMFAEEHINDAIEVIDGMSGAIGSFVREESTKRPLSELKATFL